MAQNTNSYSLTPSRPHVAFMSRDPDCEDRQKVGKIETQIEAISFVSKLVL